MWPFGGRTDARREPLPPAAARYAVIDTELTGLDERRDSIVSLGGLRVAQGRIDLADRYYEEARPAAALTPASIVLHGITPEETRGRPEIGGLLQGFLAFCAGDILVGHFIEIDLQFLGKELSRAGLPPLVNRPVDTWALYDWLSSRTPHDGGPGLPRLHDPRLPELAQTLGVPCGREHHALADAFVTAQVFQRLLRRLPRWEVATVDHLLRIGDPRRAREGNHHREGLAPLA
ncbi:MAG TPA: 3'-5' exonuclease [Candidatus Methanoperedens sp.]|nr:3'-5' exonuclease [Candidatus Methanoperedens sp.]